MEVILYTFVVESIIYAQIYTQPYISFLVERLGWC